MQLHPRENFTIVRQIEDHTDSNTYYIRAVIRNAKTDALITTINLTDQGSRRFSKSWLVPADVSNQGYWICILSSVYTDSGYTTKSPLYGDKMDTYLVQERQIFNPNYPLPTGQDIDYRRIEKIIENLKVTVKQEIEGIIDKAMTDKVNGINSNISKIVIPKTDMTSVIREIQSQSNNLIKNICAIDIPKTDLMPLSNTIDSAITIILDELKNHKDLMESHKQELASMFHGSIKEHLEKNSSRYTKLMEIKKMLEEELPGTNMEMPEMNKITKEDRVKKILNK